MITDFFKDFTERHKRKMQSSLIQQITDDVNVRVSEREIYITVCGVPVTRLENNDTVASILCQIDDIVEARLRYEGVYRPNDL